MLVTMIVIFALSAGVIGYTFYHRKKIPCMTGMMIAMTLGMTVGLTAGVILGVMYTGNMFMSTLLGMTSGMVVGFLAGSPVGVMAVLDGVLAGVMGGMMGAMLGEMIPVDSKTRMVEIMFVLFVNLILILLYMMQQELTTRQKTRRSLFHNPLFFAVALAGFFLWYNQLVSSTSLSEAETEGKKDTQPNSNAESIPSIVIEANEYAFSPSELQVAAQQTVTLVLKNTGNQEHDLEIIGLDSAIIKQQKGHEGHGSSRQAGGSMIHLHSGPGQEKSITFVPLRKGMYQIVCTIPGHRENGMKGLIKVI